MGGMFDLHVVEHGGEFWAKSMGLRRYLLDHPDQAKGFGLEKVRILNVGAWTARRYLAARANYFREMMIRANA